MKMTLRALAVTLLAASLGAACGYTDPGDGSHTLEVQATLAYGIAKDSTKMKVDVKAGNAAAANATVTLTDADTNATFILPAKGSSGSYQLEQTGYHRRLQLKVESGNDTLTCQIEAPGRHTLKAPSQGAVVNIGQGLEVAWSTEDGVRSDKVSVKLKSSPQGPWSTGTDSGSYGLPANVLVAGPEVVTVTRTNQVIPAGGAGTSFVTASYEVEGAFTVQP
ncbi:MAG TPA: hypothetical protein VFH51_01610 [Myxococcota bacterium]|nr:hypothetical protein [Myxococcota bacterium]